MKNHRRSLALVVRLLGATTLSFTLTFAPWAQLPPLAHTPVAPLLDPRAMALAYSDSEFNKICGDVMDGDGNVKANPYQNYYTKKIEYCTAAVDADKAAGYLLGTAIMYTVIFGVCLAAFIACVTPYPVSQALGQGLSIGCQVGGAAVAVADGIWNSAVQVKFKSTATQIGQIVGAVGGLAGGAGMLLVGAGGTAKEGSKEAGKEAGSSSDPQKFSCSTATAAMLGIQAGLHLITATAKYWGLKDAIEASKKNLQLAKDFNPELPGGPNIEVNAFQGARGATAGRFGNIVGKGSGSEELKKDEDKKSICEGASADSICADPTGAAATAGTEYLGRPDVQAGFKKSSGRDIGGFFQDHTGSDAPGAAGAGLLDQATIGKITGLAENALREQPEMMSAAAYTGGGAKGRGAKGGGDDLGNMMQGLMGQLLPKKDAKKEDDKVLDFGARIEGKTPEQVFEDRGLSLFQRVEYRYKRNMANQSIESLPWSVQYNQVTAGGSGKR